MPKNVTVVFTCDVCGKPLEEGSALAFSINYAIPGKDNTGKVMKCLTCPDEQHFGCSPEHAAEAAKACIDHLEQLRQQKAAEGEN